MKIRVRSAISGDEALIFEFIMKHAKEEKRDPNRITASVEKVRQHVFGDEPQCFVLIAEVNDKPVGFLLYFFVYAVYMGDFSMYIDQLFVDSAHRRKGVARRLLRHAAQIAKAKNCWSIISMMLKKSEAGHALYECYDAECLSRSEMVPIRITGDAFKKLLS